MNTSPALGVLEQAVAQQVLLAGGDPAAEAGAAAVLGAIEPAMHQVALFLAEQAALEVGAQLPEHEVEVVLIDSEPMLRVRAIEVEADVAPGDFEARLTLRLTESLKGLVEESAGQAGDSVNTWVVKTLSSRAQKRKGRGRRITESFDL